MNYILYHYEYSGNVYTEMIVNVMKEQCNLVAKRNDGWFEYTQKDKTWKPLKSIMKILEGDNNIINWGNHIFREDEYFDLNVPSAISRTSNKRTARQILQTTGIAVPKTYFDENLSWTKTAKYPIIVRPEHHLKSKNFDVMKNELELTAFLWGKADWYASEVFRKTNEYRVHTAHGKVLLVNEKPFYTGDVATEAQVNTRDWWALRWSAFNPKICQEALKATEALGLDYAAVDVMYNAEDGSLAICELNTDPDVGVPYSSGKYAAYFDWVIRHDFPEHFKLDGTSVFYNQILES